MKRFISIFMVLSLLLLLFCGCKSKEGLDLNQVTGGAGGSVNTNTPGNFDEFLEDGEEEQSSEQPEQTPQEQTPADGEEQPQQPADQEPSQEQPEKEDSHVVEQEEAPVDYTTDDWITICSYNVKVLCYDHFSDSNGGPMSKLDAVVAELKTIDADVVGLQELDRYSSRCGAQVDQLETLARVAGYPYYYYTKTIPSGTGDYGHGILSRYPIKKSESFHFKDFNLDGQGSEPRAYSRTELQVGNKTLVLYNTHLAGKQVEQMLHITLKMEKDMEKGKYAVLTGDMNAYPKNLSPSVDKDYCTMLNTVENPQNTTYRETLTHEKVNPIDNIVVTNNLEYYWDKSLKTGIMTIETSASDHLPIYTYIRMKK